MPIYKCEKCGKVHRTEDAECVREVQPESKPCGISADGAGSLSCASDANTGNEVNRFGTELLLSCYGFHKRKEASMNQDKDQDRDCPTCIHHVADWRLCSREDQEKLGIWTEPDGPCPGWEPKGGEDGRP